MSASPYASDAKIAETLTALGAEALASNEQALLQQLVVAAATGGGGGGGGATNALLLAGASSSNLAGLTAATAGTGGLFYGTQAGADRKFTMTAAGATLVEAANATDQKTALGLAAVQPFILAFKNITVLTTGTPADLATATLPTWCTRYMVMLTGSRAIAETAVGTLAAASFILRDAASGGGNFASSSFSGPATTNALVNVTGSAAGGPAHTSSQLFLRQTANSANAGTLSVYAVIVPLL